MLTPFDAGHYGEFQGQSIEAGAGEVYEMHQVNSNKEIMPFLRQRQLVQACVQSVPR